MPPEHWHETGAILDACDQALREAQTRIAIPRRFGLGVREMFALQPRLEHPRGRRTLRVLEHPRFRAAYDFLLLRAEVGVADKELAEWWTRIQVLPQEERVALVQARPQEPVSAAEGGAPSSGRRRRRRRRGGASRS